MDVRSEDRVLAARRRRGLAFGTAGVVLLFIPAILLVLVPELPALYAVVVMLVGIALLVAGFIALPGSLQNILRPKS